MPYFGSHHWSRLSCSKRGHADDPCTLAALHSPSEEPGELALQGASFFPSCAGGRTHSETKVGCIVSCTTATSCSLNWLKSTSLRSVTLKASSVRTASYLRRKKRRSMPAWMRLRRGWNNAAIARVEATMAMSEV